MLDACGFQRGERFELVRLQQVPGRDAPLPRNLVSTDPAAAARWVATDPVNVYLTLNPLHAKARPRGHASKVDIAVARCLHLDVDPRELGDRRDAERLAQDLARFLRLQLEVGPAVIGSRGRGLILRHEDVKPDEADQVRKAFLEGLAYRFRGVVPGAFLDPAPFYVSASARLVGSINPKVNEPVQLLDPGQGVVSWGRFARLADELRRELPPPLEGKRLQVPPETRQLLQALVSDQDWSWAGAQAGRRGVHGHLVEVVPPHARAAFERGAGDAPRRWTKPSDPALTKRIERAFDKLKDSADGKAAVAAARDEIQVEQIVRRLDGSRANIDLHLKVAGVQVLVRGLDGKALRSYSAVAARAAEASDGAWLPTLGTKAAEFWDKAIAEAWPKRQDVQAEGTLLQAVKAALRMVLRGRQKGDLTRDDLVGGKLMELDGGRFGLHPELVVAEVRDVLAQDIVPREVVAEAAQDLGADLSARATVMDEGQPVRRRVWAWPTEARSPEDL